MCHFSRPGDGGTEGVSGCLAICEGAGWDAFAAVVSWILGCCVRLVRRIGGGEALIGMCPFYGLRRGRCSEACRDDSIWSSPFAIPRPLYRLI